MSSRGNRGFDPLRPDEHVSPANNSECSEKDSGRLPASSAFAISIVCGLSRNVLVGPALLDLTVMVWFESVVVL